MIRVVADRKRRATILLMVVSVLALLFVIVTGFLSLARFDRVAFEDVRAGRDGEAALRAVNDLVLSMLREQWLDPGDPNSRVLDHSTGVTWEDIPGYRGARYQAAIDPIYTPEDPNQPPWIDDLSVNNSPIYGRIASLRYGAVSALERLSPADTPLQPWVVSLMLDNDQSESLASPDFVSHARGAFMDADSDGVVDSSIFAALRATELANGVAGNPIRAPRIVNYPPPGIPGILPGYQPLKPSALVRNGNAMTTLDEQWRRFYELARYEAAVRVVPHGGLVPLQSFRPSGYTGPIPPWNWYFTAGMWNSIKRERRTVAALNPTTFDPRFDELAAQSAAVEPHLRRRGGLLATYGVGNQRDEAAVPGILAALETWAQGTFGIESGMQARDYWQRFNVAESNGQDSDALRWAGRMALDTLLFNTAGPPLTPGGLRYYDRRHLLTTTSYSDDLARVQADHDGNPALGELGLPRGAVKFYLGEIDNAFVAGPGYFRDGFGGTPDARGWQIVTTLANYFAAMLEGHEFSSTDEVVTRSQQAWMLAVNAVAAAAPRRPHGASDAGFIDMVTSDPTVSGNEYVGYAPQPFITQVVLYDTNDDRDSEDLSVLVELYNPNDPLFTGGAGSLDEHALYLPQFAISLNGVYQPGAGSIPGALFVLDPAQNQGSVRIASGPDSRMPNRFPGREFMSVEINSEGVSAFNALIPSYTSRVTSYALNYPSTALDTDSSGSDEFVTVKLWRRGRALSKWVLVDQLRVPWNETDPDPDVHYSAAWRDCSSDAYFGPADNVLPVRPPARWRMATAFEPTAGSDPNEPGTGRDRAFLAQQGDGSPSTLGAYTLEATTSAAPPLDLPLGSPRTITTGPTTPLYLMNAGATPDLLIHGARRPRSYPTVGFLAFVPRFSHVIIGPTGGVVQMRPITKWLRDHWRIKNHSGFAYPADFGHMPIFDNRQDAESNSYFSDDPGVGRVPWGQLVFDYFTTINPAGENPTDASDDIDPRRVPGRINVNSAPWYVLANIPILGPGLSAPSSELSKLRSASPAFWLTSSGILFGTDRDPSLGPQPRFIGNYSRLPNWQPDRSLPFLDSDAGWWKLGSWLAQSAVAYRDRLRYNWSPSDPAAPYFGTSDQRNGGSGLPYREPGLYGPIRRGDGSVSNPTRFGFVTLGEFANVLGFDSRPPTDFAGGPSGAMAPLGVGTSARHGDFMKAVSLMALLDTHFLTTRSNTFTIYVSLMDREDPQRSIRSQLTVDRSNLLPRFVPLDRNGDGRLLFGEGVTIDSAGKPALIAERTSAYFNARYDD